MSELNTDRDPFNGYPDIYRRVRLYPNNRPTSFPVMLPLYGNYGGPRYGDKYFVKAPIDSLDREFMFHDFLYTVTSEEAAD